MDSLRAISSSTLKRLYAAFAGLCAIPDCPHDNTLPNGTPSLEIAHIRAPYPGGPRYDPRIALRERNEYPNLILLCPEHHRLVDSFPNEYTVHRLLNIRDRHLLRVRKILGPSTAAPVRQAAANRLQQALQVWADERLNRSEEFWHQLFVGRPELLAPTTQGRAFALNSKCYVGGKAINNSGGNILDFLAQHNGDVVVIEIKTPVTPLLAREYRSIYPPSHELSGAITQALNYRQSLLNDLHALRSQSPTLTVHSPAVFVLAGDANRELDTEAKRRSFQLTRNALKDVTVLTYDDLFDGLATLAVWMEPAEHEN
ncbi:Shedu anti-phage system protein SduA domain-containing protein [Nonomuraea sp. NPDC005692]|uniref:Shedu anti-phage system protein SduA domain-containing protein n=1 Tax=Nonomuraea sp. NPDC005692 TaxID=3157168 RepID=UPI0033EE696A